MFPFWYKKVKLRSVRFWAVLISLTPSSEICDYKRVERFILGQFVDTFLKY
jgi:hypothetical protein